MKNRRLFKFFSTPQNKNFLTGHAQEVERDGEQEEKLWWGSREIEKCFAGGSGWFSSQFFIAN